MKRIRIIKQTCSDQNHLHYEDSTNKDEDDGSTSRFDGGHGDKIQTSSIFTNDSTTVLSI